MESSRNDFSQLLIIICAASILTIASGQTLMNATQRSIYNEYIAELALDSNPSTCYMSGWDTDSWWKASLASPIAVAGVSVMGILSAAFNVRVGNMSESLGMRRGIDTNPLCNFQLGLQSPFQSESFYCTEIIVGQWISIQVVDPIAISQMRLCEVNVITA